LNVLMYNASAQAAVYLTQPGIDDEAASDAEAPLSTIRLQGPGLVTTVQVEAWTDVDGKIGARSNAPATYLRIATVGYRNVV
jgi:hypothetical protein